MQTENDPDKNQITCPTCGRSFDTEGEFRPHEVECAAAKQSTATTEHQSGAGADREKHPDREWHSVP